MNTFIKRRSQGDFLGVWEQFCRWITSKSHLYWPI